MARIDISFDSTEKTLSITMDGQVMEDICGVNIYESYSEKEEFRCEIRQRKEDETNDVLVYTTMMASAQEVDEALRIVQASAVERDITEFFKKKR